MPETLQNIPEELTEESLGNPEEESKIFSVKSVRIEQGGMNKNLFKNSLEKTGGPIYFSLNLKNGEIVLTFDNPALSSSGDIVYGEFSLGNVGNINNKKWESTLSFLDYERAEKAGLHNNKTLEEIKAGIMGFLDIRDKPKDMAPHKVR